MIIHEIAQGSLDWIILRRGLPTSSQFHRIFQPERKKPSRQREMYLLELLDEWSHKQREAPFENEWTRRGRELERLARFSYAMEKKCAVREVGFVTRDDGKVGGSPDGFVGDDVVLEIKCKSPKIHAKLKEKDPKHTAQVQGLLYLCERSVAHLYCYGDKQESVLKEIPRDREWIESFVPELDRFIDELDAMKAEVEANYRRAG